ncbi:hypothetical protein HYU10_00095 [Candidatus Woesearchaeota archaeon]|nr:hypothetical protein [Candidatus Woesearchaeota archaeon]MBI2130151.1 hypothetical protein [Candidatus Woesearchaeota archaeon]
MGKNKDIGHLTNLMAKSLRHKIGAIVNTDEIYANKYAKDSENIMKEAKRVLLRHNWDNDDKIEIKEQLRVKLHKDLEEKDFLDDRKFAIMDAEIEKALREFGL